MTSAAGPARVVPFAMAHLGGYYRTLDTVARERRPLAMVQAPPLADVTRFAEARLEAGDPFFVAVEGEDVVGWCDITRRRLPGLDHAGVLGMGLLRDHRGRGLGRLLLDRAVEAAFAVGLDRIELEVWSKNVIARRLYERAGFVEEGVRHRARHLDGEWEDSVLMARLRPS